MGKNKYKSKIIEANIPLHKALSEEEMIKFNELNSMGLEVVGVDLSMPIIISSHSFMNHTTTIKRQYEGVFFYLKSNKHKNHYVLASYSSFINLDLQRFFNQDFENDRPYSKPDIKPSMKLGMRKRIDYDYNDSIIDVCKPLINFLDDIQMRGLYKEITIIKNRNIRYNRMVGKSHEGNVYLTPSDFSYTMGLKEMREYKIKNVIDG